MVNSQAERLFGYSREELVGQKLEMLLPKQFRHHHQHKVDSFFADPAFRPMGKNNKLFGCHKDGSEFRVQISLSPVETEAGIFVSSSIRKLDTETP